MTSWELVIGSPRDLLDFDADSDSIFGFDSILDLILSGFDWISARSGLW